MQLPTKVFDFDFFQYSKRMMGLKCFEEWEDLRTEEGLLIFLHTDIFYGLHPEIFIAHIQIYLWLKHKENFEFKLFLFANVLDSKIM